MQKTRHAGFAAINYSGTEDKYLLLTFSAALLYIELLISNFQTEDDAMNRQIFINLATKNLSNSKVFFEELGFQFNPNFTNEDGGCLIIAENISVMLLSESHFKNFTDKAICDSKQNAETLLCISCDSRAEVDSLVSKAKSLGANVLRESQDHGFMYGHGFEDLDGHTWELIFMDQNHNQC